jgi:uncharacterized protein YndB with AHSA1/START domain
MSTVVPFRFEREFSAPQQLVWECFTEAEHLVEWFGPVGLGLEIDEFEAEPGGVFRYAMEPPQGATMHGRWDFQELRAPDRLVHLVSFCDEEGRAIPHPMAPVWPLRMQATVTLETRAGRTAFSLSLLPWEATPEEEAAFAGAFDSMTLGFTGTYRQLETYLSTFRY